MSANFLHEFREDTSELQKQIGCMTGIFQMFDRHHLLSGRQFNVRHNKRLPSGHSSVNACSVKADHVACSPQLYLEKNISKSSSENQRMSMESSRTSFSSSSCSSFSSVDCNKSTLQENLFMDQANFPDRSLNNSNNVKRSEIHAKAFLTEPRHPSSRHDHQSQDIRDVVTDSINKESRCLSVKTSYKRDLKQPVLNNMDSPRPVILAKSTTGSYVIATNEKPRSPLDLNESFQTLTKLKKAPQKSGDMEPSRSSFEAKESPFRHVSKDAPRFSYDGREIAHTLLDSWESGRTASKHRELPRLSLDSKESSLRSSNSMLNDLSRSSIKQRSPDPPITQKEPGIQRTTPSVVAKLMGLDTLPTLSSVSWEEVKNLKSSATKEPESSSVQNVSNYSQNSFRASKYELQSLGSSRCSHKDTNKPWIKHPEMIMKPLSTAKTPIEPAPWKRQEKLRSSQKTFTRRDGQLNQQHETVYSEIEKRLKELEFRDSNKDLRALKQILDAMQAKGLLKSKKNEQYFEKLVHKNSNELASTVSDQNMQSSDAWKPPLPRSMKGGNATKTYKSPIVIMKPAKSLNRSDFSSTSVIPLHDLTRLHRLHTQEPVDKKKAFAPGKFAKECAPKPSPRMIAKTEEAVQRGRSRTELCSSMPQQTSRGSIGSLEKSTNAVSPRLQQRKLEVERKMRSCAPPPDSVNKQRMPTINQPPESVSPRNKIRRRPTRIVDNDVQVIENTETRSLNQQGNDMSRRSDSIISFKQDAEVTSADKSTGMKFSSFPQENHSPIPDAPFMLKQKNPPIGFSEEVLTLKLAALAPEQPSPISVLDASLYQDEPPVSLLKRSSKGSTDSGECWESEKIDYGFNHKKLESIENLMQKLRALNSPTDNSSTTDHIASLCETQNPDHRYISEILLASGLLMKDLINSPLVGLMPVQIPPINSDLFLVLELTKSSRLPKSETLNNESTCRKSNYELEKLHRKLVFDVVNEVLGQKLELSCLEARSKVIGRFSSGQQLLKELCSELDKLQAESTKDEISDEESNITGEQEPRISIGWSDCSNEVLCIVLDVERSIFKDLIDDIISDEAALSSSLKLLVQHVLVSIMIYGVGCAVCMPMIVPDQHLLGCSGGPGYMISSYSSSPAIAAAVAVVGKQYYCLDEDVLAVPGDVYSVSSPSWDSGGLATSSEALHLLVIFLGHSPVALGASAESISDRDIPTLNVELHYAHCSRNLQKCLRCGEMVPKKHADEHYKESHAPVLDNYGIDSAEKNAIDKKLCLVSQSWEFGMLEIFVGEMDCSFCSKTIEHEDWPLHQGEKCPQRIVTCEYCEFPLPAIDLHEHQEVCGNRTELCPTCNKYIRLRERINHVYNCEADSNGIAESSGSRNRTVLGREQGARRRQTDPSAAGALGRDPHDSPGGEGHRRRPIGSSKRRILYTIAITGIAVIIGSVFLSRRAETNQL
ncbi:Protein LONGIFOLIA 1 [Apostasia shenzhenica]|uniref:Protein LONGIFOLIA 1 n=1 Tax=Apostasia shenzhenica TaxID=1088818 RepID=A0A2I0BDL3_9ASPA|nr:Protein LONGIFOLIA 1 [Apostasia shenzhenica]